MVLEAKQSVNLVDERGNTLDFVLDLLRSHENVGIVLCEAANAH